MSGGTSFTIFDPVAQLIATGGGGGGGGVDGTFQAKQPAAVANNVAFFGSGGDLGQTVDSGLSVDNNLLNPPSNTTLWVSNRLIGALQYGAEVFKATASINIEAESSLKAFSAGNATVGPATWPNIASTFTLDGAGVATIANSLQYATYYRIIFSANKMSESTGSVGRIICYFQDEAGPTLIGVTKTLECLPTGAPFDDTSAFCNEVYLTALVSVAASSSFSFSVILNNPGDNQVTIDPSVPGDPCLLIIERVA